MASQPVAVTEYATPLVASNPARLARLKAWFERYTGEHVVKLASVLTLIGIWYVDAALLPSSVMPAPHTVVGVLLAIGGAAVLGMSQLPEGYMTLAYQ